VIQRRPATRRCVAGRRLSARSTVRQRRLLPHCCSSKAALRKPPRSIAPASASMTRSCGHRNIPAMSGPCTAMPSAARRSTGPTKPPRYEPNSQSRIRWHGCRTHRIVLLPQRQRRGWLR